MLHSNRGAAVAVSLVLLSVWIAMGGGALIAAPSTDGESHASSPVNINTAGAEQLTAIPGIGESMARRIVEWREEHGPFLRIEDLMKVKGIGEKSLDKMRPHVTVGKTD